MAYDAETATSLYHDKRPLVPVGVRKRISNNGYVSGATIYECMSCADCSFSQQCKKGDGNRRLYAGKTFMQKRDQSLRNITTEEGILLRMNRSI